MNDTGPAERLTGIAPNYAPPPWTYTGTRVLNVVCRPANAAAVRDWVPEPLQLARDDGMFVLMFMYVPALPELGPHYRSTECGIIVPVRAGATTGSTFALMFVDNDIALAAGREIWGYPKKLGDVRFEESGATAISARASHLAYRGGGAVFSVEADLDGSEAPEVKPFLAGLEPRLLRREIPNPCRPDASSVDILEVALQPIRVLEQRSGRARVDISASEERLDRCGPVEALGAVFQVADFVLPYARRRL